ncbi:unnamed protein product [Dracunculus medinensis]|uniref:ANK_REP_REGION domain-containing protein n=1 Tax=Dracunculus medinensis TaxID=318479 RepID=A0A0N4U1B4_DRAME|nr:unnamed protein product [Dracunculus medinensis]
MLPVNFGTARPYRILREHLTGPISQKLSQFLNKVGVHGCTYVIQGELLTFCRRLQYIEVILKKSENGVVYQKMGEEELIRLMIAAIIKNFDQDLGNCSILHQLIVRRNKMQSCSERDHGSCKMLFSLLYWMPHKMRQNLLSRKIMSSGRTLVHFVAAVGDPCLMNVLRNFDFSVDVLDNYGNTPLFWALKHDSIEMVRRLLWYGSDISFKQSLSALITNSKVEKFFIARREALEILINEWINEFVSGVWTLNVDAAVSDVHFTRVLCEDLQSLDKKTIILFIIPCFYKNEDRFAAVKDPKLSRSSFYNKQTGDIIKIFKKRPRLMRENGDSDECIPLNAAFTIPHNGLFYAYEMPKVFKDTYKLQLTLNNLQQLESNAHAMLLAFRVLSCSAPLYSEWHLRYKCDKKKVA